MEYIVGRPVNRSTPKTETSLLKNNRIKTREGSLLKSVLATAVEQNQRYIQLDWELVRLILASRTKFELALRTVDRLTRSNSGLSRLRFGQRVSAVYHSNQSNSRLDARKTR
jgi:hypothetical protein